LVLVSRKPCECRVAVVEAWHNQRYDQRLEHGFGHRAPAGLELSQVLIQADCLARQDPANASKSAIARCTEPDS